MASTSARTPDGGRRAKLPLGRRHVFFALGLLLAVGALVLAVVQPPPADPFAPRSPLQMFADPWEVNAAARLPEVKGDLLGLHVSDDGRTIWVVGGQRAACVSRDAGRSWVPVTLPTFPAEGTKPADPPKPDDIPKKENPKKDAGKESKAMAFDPHVFAQPYTRPTNGKADGIGPPKAPPAKTASPPPVGSALTAVNFTADGREGWVVGTHGVMFHTADGGGNWMAIRLAGVADVNKFPAAEVSDFLAVQATGDGVVRAVDHYGSQYHYSTKSAVWTKDRVGGGGVDAVCLLPDDALLQVLQTFVFRVESPRGVGVTITYGVGVIGTTRGTARRPDGSVWLVGDAGGVLKNLPVAPQRVEGADTLVFTVGEIEPRALSDGSKPNLRAVAFADDTRGAVGGEGGYFAHTPDGGDTWKPSAVSGLRDTQTVRAMWLSTSDGWAVGTDGLLARTPDGGATWHSFARTPGGGGQSFTLPAVWFYLALAVAGLCLLLAARPGPPVEVKGVPPTLTPDRPLEPGERDVMRLGEIAAALSSFLRNENTLPPLTTAVLGKWGSGKSSLMNLLRKDLEGRGFCPVWFNAWHHSTQTEDQLLAGLLANVIRQGVPPWFSVGGVAFRVKLFWARLRRVWLPLLVGLAAVTAAGAYYFKSGGFKNVNIANLGKTLEDSQNQAALACGVGGLVGVLSLGRAAHRGLQSFGVDVGALLAGVGGKGQLSALDAKASFRLTFAKQFREVTAALNPRTLVVFVDDLDRCRPQNVLEVMEAMNFLSSSGDCFIVLGMDWDYVHRSVGLGFEKVAEALADPGTKDSRASREQFARKYLEKLITFRVAVPTPDDKQLAEFVIPAAPQPTADTPKRPRFDFIRWTNRLKTAGIIAALVLVPLLVAWRVQPPKEKPAAVTDPTVSPDDRSLAVGAVAGGLGTATTQVTVPVEVDRPPPPPNGPVQINSAVAAAFPWGVVAGGLVVGGLLLAGVFGLLRAPAVVVKDSDEFTDALGVWIGAVTEKRQTARSLKQFINRLRYLAARRRGMVAEPTLWDRLRRLVRLAPPAASPAGIREAELVQWGVLEEVCPAALKKGAKDLPPDVVARMKRHADTFKKTTAAQREEERKAYQQLASELSSAPA